MGVGWTALIRERGRVMARIVGYLPIEELETRYRAARDATEARHFQAIWLLAQGRTFLEVTAVLAFVPRWVEELAARCNAFGPGALGDQRRRNGRTASLLTPDLLAALAERLKMPPADGGLWSGPKVAAWMARQLGLATVHPQRGWEALKRIEWSIQAPRPRHPRAATPEEQAACKGGSGRRWRGPGRRIPTGRSRSGPRTVGRTASDPPRPEADPAPGLGPRRPAAGRARSPPPPMAARRRLRAADQRRGGLVPVHRPLEAVLRRTARGLRAADRRRARAAHRPRARRRRPARTRGLGRPGRDHARVPASVWPRASARRAALASGGRADRQPTPRHDRGARRHRRRAPPPSRPHHHQATHRLPLLAQAD